MKQEYEHLHEIGEQVSKGLIDGITAAESKQIQVERLAIVFKKACRAFDDAWTEHFHKNKPTPRKEEFFIGEYLYNAGCRIIDDDHKKQSYCHLYGCREADEMKLRGALKMQQTPTADVVEVRHGEWIMQGLANPKCSLCNSYAYSKDNYCPNCGAKMDGERREECKQDK